MELANEESFTLLNTKHVLYPLAKTDPVTRN